MARRHEALERRKRGLVEHLRHKAEVLRSHDRLAVAHRDARALLTAVLQRLQAVARHARHILAGRVHAEDRALLLKTVGALARHDGITHETLPSTDPSTLAMSPSSTCAAPASSAPVPAGW